MALHCSTIVSTSPSILLSKLSQLPISLRMHTLLFTLSTNVQSSELSHLVSSLTSFSSQTIGCLSAPVPRLPKDMIVCSMAVFDNVSTKPFRSTIEGREEIAVGRNFGLRKGHSGRDDWKDVDGLKENVDWEDVWRQGLNDNGLPNELQSLKPEDISTVLYLSSPFPEGISRTLSTHLPSAIKLGLIASSTPFITGRSVTLFQNDKVYSDGAVGLALTSSSKPTLRREFPGLEAITPPLTITRSEGNLINELDSANPTQILISAIRKARIADPSAAKENQFFIGVVSGAGSDELTEVYNILSGDSLRGTIALESDDAPREGSVIRMYHQISTPSTTSNYKNLSACSGKRVFSFTSSPSGSEVGIDVKNSTHEIGDIVNRFISCSENGFIFSRSHEVGWKCLVQDGSVSLEWNLERDGRGIADLS